MDELRIDVDMVVRWVLELESLVIDAEVLLTELDAAIGDADHVSNMVRGLRASSAAVLSTAQDRDSSTPAEALRAVGLALTQSIGGSSGPLYGTIFTTLAETVPDAPTITAADLVSGLRKALHSVQDLGAAVVGDKTMIDAIAPAVDEMERTLNDGNSPTDVVAAGVVAAERGALATIPLRARKGRASYLGSRSEGHQDPGATSSALLFRALHVLSTADSGEAPAR